MGEELTDGGGAAAAVTWFRDVRRSELMALVALDVHTALADKETER